MGFFHISMGYRWRKTPGGGAEPFCKSYLARLPGGDSLWSPNGVAESPEGNGPYGSPPGRSFYSCASSRALLHVGSLSLWDRQPSNAPPLLLSPAGLASRRGPPYQNTLGAVPQGPLTLKLRLDTLSRCLRRILFWLCRNRIKITPYKRRRVGRNLRLSRADPALCSGQPSPLRCILLSPQGLTTLRGPRLYGAYRRVGFLGWSPE